MYCGKIRLKARPQQAYHGRHLRDDFVQTRGTTVIPKRLLFWHRWPTAFAIALATGCTKSPPRLGTLLQVVADEPKTGEPTTFISELTLVCAKRHQEPIACAGVFPFALTALPETPTFQTNVTDLPWEVQDLDAKKIVARWGGGACILSEAGLITCRTFSMDGNEATHPPWSDPAKDLDVGGPLCAILQTGEVVCDAWEECPADKKPFYTVPGIKHATSIATGTSLSCVAQADGKVMCWGDYEQSETCANIASPVEGLDDVVVIHGDSDAFCALTADNKVWCWGDNYLHMLGVHRETTRESMTPVEITQVGQAVDLAIARGSAVALTTTGDVWMWGRSAALDPDDATPKRAEDVSNAIDVFSGHNTGCALLADHEIRCFGRGLRNRATKVMEHPKFEDKQTWVNAREYVLAEEYTRGAQNPDR